MRKILGIDPGSRVTGFGIISCQNSQFRYLEAGTIRTQSQDFAVRLQQIHQGITEIIANYQPNDVAIEAIFMHHNPMGALKLGQARGAAIVAVKQNALPLSEYSPRQVKQAVVGTGAAEKIQVQHMVKQLLNIQGDLGMDASDALAIAICHAQRQKSDRRIAAAIEKEKQR